MSILRSENLWLAAYFLSRCGNKKSPHAMPDPPALLKVSTWNEAYDAFFETLGEGRTTVAFRRTLKNARDLFDGHLDSGRIGWRELGQGRPPQPLSAAATGVLARWSQCNDEELWNEVRHYVKLPGASTEQHSHGTHEGNSRRRREHLLDAITKEDILKAFQLFDGDHPHGFADSTKFNLIHEGKAYPPKAILGLAAVPRFGEPLGPDDFTGGAGSKCFRILAGHGFQIVPKPSEFLPTADEVVLNKKTKEALAAPTLSRPVGQKAPRKASNTSTVFERDPLVRAWVLKRAAGKCECCGMNAPFLDRSGEPFLEVHHINPLANNGEDVVENAAAICPNCHRECHFGRDAAKLRQRLLEKAITDVCS